jgi:hypothetical protein
MPTNPTPKSPSPQARTREGQHVRWQERCLKYAHSATKWVRAFLRIIARPYFSIGAVLIFEVLLHVDQGQDMLRILAEDSASHNWWSFGLFELALFLFSAVIWYMARLTYYFKPTNHLPSEFEWKWLKHWAPRLLGVAPFLLTMCEALRAGTTISGGSNWKWPAFTFLAGMVFLGVILLRRKELAKAGEARRARIEKAHDDAAKHFGPFGKSFSTALKNIQIAFDKSLNRYPELQAKEIDHYTNILDLDPRARTLILVVVLAGGFCLAYLSFFPFPLWARGSAQAVALLALTILVVLATVMAFISRKLDVSLLSIAVVMMVLFSFFGWTDNHVVRTLPNQPWADAPVNLSNAQIQTAGQILQPHVRAWLQAVPREPVTVPVVIVTGEGGGIRAAYWIARVLAEVQCRGLEQSPNGSRVLRFSDHLYAISSVSGSSLGSAAFVAWLRHPDSLDREKCRSHIEVLRRMFGSDFLSPVVASLLFPDLLQRVLPVPLLPDRAQAMEEAWERSWADANGLHDEPGEFAQPFSNFRFTVSDTRTGMSASAVPLLVFNGTVVETGQRLIIAPVRWAASRFHVLFKDSLQAADLLPTTTRLSTAVLLSARFPVVSPAGTMPPQPGEPRGRWLRAVDGGYVENTGALTAAELLAALLAARPDGVQPRSIVLHISNGELDSVAEEARDTTHRGSGEALSVITAALATRGSHGSQALAALKDLAEAEGSRQGVFMNVALCKSRVMMPLGWALSQAAQLEMEMQLQARDGRQESVARQVDPTARSGARNSNAIDKILSILKNPTANIESGEIIVPRDCAPDSH